MTNRQVGLAWVIMIIALIVLSFNAKPTDQSQKEASKHPGEIERTQVMARTCDKDAKALGCEKFTSSYYEYQKFTERN